MLVGLDTFDDAGVYRISDELALVQTVDFFTPIVDDPYDWGRIAAANALSDIYAMGAVPVTALNLLSFPVGDLDLVIAAQVLAGGVAKVDEAGAVLLGGHSIDDKEPKYGLAVTGLVHPNKIVSNAGARLGDCLVLTKPIGIGILTTALKAGLLSQGSERRVTELMATLNKTAMEAMVTVGVHAATDVTGFGLLGHLWEMARASHVTINVDASAVPVIDETFEMLDLGALPGGSMANAAYLEANGAVQFGEGVSEALQTIFADANTSGGLVIAVAPERCAELVALLQQKGASASAVIGHVAGRSPGLISVRV